MIAKKAVDSRVTDPLDPNDVVHYLEKHYSGEELVPLRGWAVERCTDAKILNQKGCGTST